MALNIIIGATLECGEHFAVFMPFVQSPPTKRLNAESGVIF